MNSRLHAFFSGRVQGVGFRAMTCRIAESCAVTGFVKNLSDGRVELVAEGDEVVLEDFLGRIKKSFLSKYTDGAEVNWSSSLEEFDAFSIEYDYL